MSTVFDLHGKTILITGAGRGIGRALALAAARSGAFVGALELDASLLRLLMAEPGTERIVALEADVTDREAVMAAASKLARGTGRIDAVINNAAVRSDSRSNPGRWHQRRSLGGTRLARPHGPDTRRSTHQYVLPRRRARLPAKQHLRHDQGRHEFIDTLDGG
jgi:NAD(P)-dependent dehydrogenase (short-subunit alcohol dehydrogenase family)